MKVMGFSPVKLPANVKRGEGFTTKSSVPRQMDHQAVKELSVWMDRLSEAQLPSSRTPPEIAAWHARLSQVERDLVEAIGQAVWSLDVDERNILYAGCNDTERKVIGICCMITEAST